MKALPQKLRAEATTIQQHKITSSNRSNNTNNNTNDNNNKNDSITKTTKECENELRR